MHTFGRKIPVPQAHRLSTSRKGIACFAFPSMLPALVVRQLSSYPSHRDGEIDRLRQIIVGP